MSRATFHRRSRALPRLLGGLSAGRATHSRRH
jgi:hypothetical protein